MTNRSLNSKAGRCDVLRRALRWMAAASLALLPQAALAAAPDICTITTPGLAFGAYTGAQLDLTATLTLQCDHDKTVVVALSTGQGSYTTRKMKSGTAELNYNLYTDINRTNVWTNVAGGTVSVTLKKNVAVNVTVYGRIPSGQDPWVGDPYQDSVTASFPY